jgi:hypothetical protein
VLIAAALGLFAALLWAAPIGAFALVRLRKAREPWAIAADLATAAAIDVLGVLALACVVPLHHAAWIARALWAAALFAQWRRSRRAIALPLALGPRELVVVGVGALVGLGSSLALSRPYSIWDRIWHIPLVSSLGAQRVPFMNVYDPKVALNYHFAGDVVAAVVQALSFRRIHAAFALSLTHDALFVITGVAVALVLIAFGPRGSVGRVAMLVGTLFVGPVTFFRLGPKPPTGGYSLFNYLTLSFRPHVVIAGLGIVGIWALVVGRLRARGAALPARRTAPQLLVIAAALAITDEASIILLAVALGALWLVRPEVVAPRRIQGALVLAGLGAVFAATNRLFGASFGRGAPHLATAFVAPRLPGYDRPSLALSTTAGLRMLLLDLFPVAIALIVGAFARLARRARDRDRDRGEGILAFYAVLVAGSLVLFSTLEVIGSSIESHRVVTAALLLSPLVGATLVSAPWARARGPAALLHVARLVLASGTTLAVASTLVWLVKIAPQQGEVHAGFFSNVSFYDIDCRAATGPQEGGSPAPFYAEQRAWYLWAGCHPVFAAAPTSNHWQLQMKTPRWGLDSLRALDPWLSAGDSLRAVCKPTSATDPICRYAQTHGKCFRGGNLVDVCALDAEDRRQLLLPGHK